MFGQVLIFKKYTRSFKSWAAGWRSWEGALGFLWTLLCPPAYEVYVWVPPVLAGVAGAQRGTGEAGGPARANTAPAQAKGKSPRSILARAEQARGTRSLFHVASGREGTEAQELTGALDVIGPTSFCVDGDTEAWRWQGLALCHSVSGGTGHQWNIHLCFPFFSFRCF